MTFEQRPEVSERISFVQIRDKNFLKEEQCKDANVLFGVV